MIRKILFASAATAAIAVAATPAAAQQVCEVNGTSTTAGTSTGSYSLVCGSAATDNGAYHTTVIGYGANAQVGSQNDVTAIGYTASGGSGDTVIGAHSSATNLASFGDTVVGSNSSATGTNSTVLGALSNDGGFTNSVALGYNTGATGNNQVAVGNRTIGQVANGVAASDAATFGQLTTAVATQDTRDDAQDVLIAAAAADSAYFAVNSVGAPATATGTNAIAIGQGATASGTNSIAIGNGANNGGFANSVAIGPYTNTAANQVVLGGTGANARIVTGVAAGTISASSVDAVNGSQLNASNNRITALEAMATDFTGDIAALNDRVDNVYRRGRAGTAVAIAMSGNGFLPDKKINVTGNVGFYSGAYAAAIQVGAILTDTVAFNAGVAKGLNDGGKMGARMGFTLGW